MRLVNRKDFEPLGAGWGRVRPLLSGICGSDLATIAGKSSFYFAARLDAVRPRPRGRRRAPRRCRRPPTGTDRPEAGPLLPRARPRRTLRVVVLPVRHHRHVSAVCRPATAPTPVAAARCSCSQLHLVPDELSEQRAVLIEPLSCAVHTALRRRRAERRRRRDRRGASASSRCRAEGAHEGRHDRHRRQARAARVGGRVRRDRDRRPEGATNAIRRNTRRSSSSPSAAPRSCSAAPTS